jgi:hypothetical protein
LKHHIKLDEIQPLNLIGFIETPTEAVTNIDDKVPLYIHPDRQNPIGTAKVEMINGRSCIVATVSKGVSKNEVFCNAASLHTERHI